MWPDREKKEQQRNEKTYLGVKTSILGIFFIFPQLSWKKCLKKVVTKSNLVNIFPIVRLESTICKLEKELHVHGYKMNILQLIGIKANSLFTENILYTNR